MSVNRELIREIFNSIDKTIGDREEGTTYKYLKNVNAVLGGTTVLLAGITDNLAQAKICNKLKQTDLDIFVHTSEIKTILGALTLFMSKLPDDDIILTKPSFIKDSPFQLYGINMKYSFEIQDLVDSDQDNFPTSINLYSIDDRRSLRDATEIYGLDVLTCYINLNTDIEKLKFVTYYRNEINNRVANITPFAAQSYFNDINSSDLSNLDRGDVFMSNSSELALSELGFRIKFGKHTIDMDPLDMKQIFTKQTNRRLILGDIADFTKYFMKVGFGKYTDELVLGIFVNKPFRRRFDSDMDPYFESFNYYLDTVENLYNFYKECINYSLSAYAPSFEHNGVTYRITPEDPAADPSVLAGTLTMHAIGTARYINVKYSFDINVYKELTEDNEKEAYYRKCFYNHCMYWTSLYRDYYNKIWNWYFTDSDYQEQVQGILSEIEEFCTKNYREPIKVDEEVDMGVAIDPIIEDIVDEDGYLNVKEALDTENFSLLYIRDSQGRLGDPIVIDKLKLVKETKRDLKPKIFYKCTDKFDRLAAEPLDIRLYNVDFTNPYYNLTGGNQEILIRYSDLQSIIWGGGSEFSANAFILEREKEIHRIASLDNINIRYGEDVTGEVINMISGYHCQSGIKKPVFCVKLAEITEFIDIEREKEEFRPVITLDDIFEKYPGAKELYESNIPKNTKIRNANRLSMDMEYRTKFMQSIMMQRENVSLSLRPPVQEYQVLSPASDIESDASDSDEPRREVGGRRRYQSDSESDTEEEPSNLQPMRLDFGDEQT